MKKNILVVAAHPDDEVLGCAGTLSRLSKEGNNVYIAILGEGITSRSDIEQKQIVKELKLIRTQAMRAGKLTGAKKVFCLDFPDNRFDCIALLEIVQTIEMLIRKLKPQIIFTHHVGDLNIDHRITHQAVLTATRPTSAMSVKEIYSFEVPSSTEWNFAPNKNQFSPNVFYDISKTISLKLRAMRLYKSEIRKFPHPRSEEALVAIAKKWGSTAGLKAAEAFELIRKVS